MKVKDIICHGDGKNFYYESIFSSKKIIDKPYTAGDFKILTKGFKNTKHDLINHCLFNQSNLARIDLPLGKLGLYLLQIRKDGMLSDIIVEPGTISVDIYVAEIGGFIYSFYNNTDAPNITITAKLTTINEKLYNNLKANLGDHVYRNHVIKSMLANPITVNVPEVDLSIEESLKKNKLVWKITLSKIVDGKKNNKEAYFSNSLPMFCIVFMIKYDELNKKNNVELDLLYEYAKKFISKYTTNKKSFFKINTLNSNRNITSAFHSFFIPKKNDSPDKKEILNNLKRIHDDCLDISKVDCRFIQVKSIEINISSSSLDEFISNIKKSLD
jgi:hypothetical protein